MSFSPEWVLSFFAAGVLSGMVRRWSGHLVALASGGGD